MLRYFEFQPLNPELVSGSRRKYAFTLAEVLITLGIIGVVAALTLPTLIAKQRSYILHNQFKKSYSLISQILLDTKTSLGMSNLHGYYTKYDENIGYYNSSEFINAYLSNMKVVKKNGFYKIKNYKGTAETESSDRGGDNPKPLYILADGSSIGMQVNNWKIRFWVDVNGPYKKPNRYGFDVFEFEINDSSDMIKPIKPSRKYTEEELEDQNFPDIAGYPCDKVSNQKLNGMGCSWYALNDINPDDDSKKYWDSLPW